MRILDTASLKVRLTVGIAALAALSLGSLSAWTSMRMQQILISTHKENMKYIASRFPKDVEIYSEMIPLQQGAQRAINSLSTADKLIWIKSSKEEIIAKSPVLDRVAISDRFLMRSLMGDTTGHIKVEGNLRPQPLPKTALHRLLTVDDVPLIPQVQDLNGSYWLMCATPLKVKNNNLGRLYLAHDITKDRMMFANLIRSLAIATVIAIAVITTIIAIYVRQSMQPLKKIAQLTSTISADKLDRAHISLEQAPSEVKELAETFEQMLSRLSEAWEHQRELLSNVSHELRTPLTIISGYIQSTLRRGTNLTAMQTEALNTAASEADRTVQLLQDLLDLARLDSGAMQFQIESVVLNDLVREVASMAKQYSHRAIEVESSNNLIAIQADNHRLKQVLLNLVDNAVKYSDPQTPITIKLARQHDRAIIQVCDRGVGISLQQQNRIFERFYRVDEARNRSGGTGLGLSIVKTLVEGMGGYISVRSQLQHGSTFTITFPYDRA